MNPDNKGGGPERAPVLDSSTPAKTDPAAASPARLIYRINVYVCTAGHRTVTRDIDEGVTPSEIRCQVVRGCPHRAQSSFYRPGPQDTEPTHEWYKPSRTEAKRQNRRFPGMLEHYKKGGLFFRAIPAPSPKT